MADLKRYLIEEAVEDYEAGRINRRQAMTALAGLTGAVLAAELLAACGKKEPAAAATLGSAGSAEAKGSGEPPPKPVPPQVAPDDPELIAGPTQFAGDGATLSGYMARPNRPGSHAIVLVCHENRGLTAYVEDVTRRVAKAGYVALAVDLLAREGGTAKFGYDEVPGLLGKAPPARHVGDFLAGLEHARAQPAARTDRVGMTGFCFGGGLTWQVAAALPDLRAAVPYYGQPVDAAQVPSINAAVLAIYAGEDARINAAIPAIEAAMTANGKTFRKVVYPGVQHAFHNDTRDRYDATAARAAWTETLAWFTQYLG